MSFESQIKNHIFTNYLSLHNTSQCPIYDQYCQMPDGVVIKGRRKHLWCHQCHISGLAMQCVVKKDEEPAKCVKVSIQLCLLLVPRISEAEGKHGQLRIFQQVLARWHLTNSKGETTLLQGMFVCNLSGWSPTSVRATWLQRWLQRQASAACSPREGSPRRTR